MDDNSVTLVGQALELRRKHLWIRLGNHELARLLLVRREVEPDWPPLQVGRELGEMLERIVESRVRPQEGECEVPLRTDWKYYIILRDYVFRGRSWGDVCDDLAISQALFFQLKREAIELLANELWMANNKAEHEILETPNNIPPAKFDFIPRADEEGRDLVARVLAGLQKRPWMASIRGFAGVGKTTLATEAAWAAIRQGGFKQVIWVSITADRAQQPDLLDFVVETIGKELGHRSVLALDDFNEKSEIIQELLEQTRCLIVIDSTEAVNDETHSEILQFIRDLPLPTCVLLVSREMGRKTELETTIALEGMREEEALEFLGARGKQQNIALREEDLQHILRITRGNPAAMLWVLGRMSQYGLPVRDILSAEIRLMPDLLSYLLMDAYSSLTLNEKKVLSALGLFSVSAPRDDIAAASGLADEPEQFMIALGGLYSRFLVNLDQDQQYSILPFTHIFLERRAEQLNATLGDQRISEFLEEANKRLADYYARRLQRCQFAARLQIIKTQRQDILDVLEACYRQEEWRRVTDLVYLTGRALGELGYWRDRIKWAERAIEASEKIGDTARRAWHRIYDLGWTYLYRDGLDRAREITWQGLAEAQELGFRAAEAVGYRNLGVIELLQRNYDEAEKNIERSISLAEEGEDMAEWVAIASSTLGRVKLEQGDAPAARKLFEKALSVRHILGDPSAEAFSLAQVALAYYMDGDLRQADGLLGRSLVMSRGIQQPSAAYGYALQIRGIIAREQDNIESATQDFRESLELYQKVGAVSKVSEVRRLIEDLTKEREGGSGCDEGTK